MVPRRKLSEDEIADYKEQRNIELEARAERRRNSNKAIRRQSDPSFIETEDEQNDSES